MKVFISNLIFIQTCVYNYETRLDNLLKQSAKK